MTLELAELVWCRHVVEHSPFPLFTLCRLYELTADNGWCIMVSVVPPYMLTINGHYSVLSHEQWAAMIRQVGFTIKDLVDRPFEPNGIIGLEQRWLLKKGE